MARETLQQAVPEVAREWHVTKNAELTAGDVTKTSPLVVWWKGSQCGHEWQAPVRSRSRGAGCRVCPPVRRQPLVMGVNDLATKNPGLAAEWHPAKNGNLSPADFSPASSKKAWWLGRECSHEWQAMISNRNRGSVCPYCAGKKILPGFNDLVTLQPGLAEEWDYERNRDLRPETLARHSRKVVWWYGKVCHHSWQAKIDQRASGAGCPYCSGRAVLAGDNDFAALCPAAARDWDYAKNGDLQPSDVRSQSNRKFWWKGADCGHEWEATPAHRVRGQNCPYCSGRRVKRGFNDLLTTNPSVAASWHPSRNGDLSPEDITVSAGRKVWWQCESGHDWQSIVANRSKGIGCPVCAGKQVVRGKTDLLTARPEVAEEWDYEKNGSLTPDAVHPHSGLQVWWVGTACGHSWKARISFRSSKSTKCPYCVGKRVLPGFNDLGSTMPMVAEQWDDCRNGALKANEVTAGSNKTVWWICDRSHSWSAAVVTRSRGVGCPYCAGFYVIPGENDLQTLNPGVASEWHPKNNGSITPKDVKIKSSKRVWWACGNGHEWQAAVSDRTGYETGCPVCSGGLPWSKAEKEVLEFVKESFPQFQILGNYRDPGLGLFELDIFVQDVRIGIEFNGEYWHDESRDPRIGNRHIRKKFLCERLGIRLAVVWENDWKHRQCEVKDQILRIVAGEETPSWMTYDRG